MRQTTLALQSFAMVVALSACGTDRPTEPPAPNPGVWRIQGTFEIADSASMGVVSQAISLAFDGAGRPCVAFIDVHREAIRYAVRDESGWSAETVVEGGDSDGHDIGLVMDAAGTPHIFYVHKTGTYGGEFHHAIRSNGTWIDEIIDDGGYCGAWSSPAFDGAGRLHVAYFAGYTYYDLRYAVHDETGWRRELVDSEGACGYGADLALDPHGIPEIVYGTADAPHEIRIARLRAGVWAREVLAAEDWTGEHMAMAQGKDGRLHIAYRAGNRSPTSISYMIVDGDTRQSEPLFSVGDAGYHPAVALDSAGRVWAAWNGLVPMTACLVDGVWQLHSLVDYPRSASQIALQASPSGRMGVAFIGADSSPWFGWLDLVPVEPGGEAEAPLSCGNWNRLGSLHGVSTGGGWNTHPGAPIPDHEASRSRVSLARARDATPAS
jgi:hypothetical protein